MLSKKASSETDQRCVVQRHRRQEIGVKSWRGALVDVPVRLTRSSGRRLDRVAFSRLVILRFSPSGGMLPISTDHSSASRAPTQVAANPSTSGERVTGSCAADQTKPEVYVPTAVAIPFPTSENSTTVNAMTPSSHPLPAHSESPPSLFSTAKPSSAGSPPRHHLRSDEAVLKMGERAHWECRGEGGLQLKQETAWNETNAEGSECTPWAFPALCD